MIGWRKLVAWGCLFALVVVAVWVNKDITDNQLDLLKWATAFFFAGNVGEHLLRGARRVGEQIATRNGAPE